MKTLDLDFETFNTDEPKVLGTYRYAETAEILIATYGIDGGPVKAWDATKNPRMPADLFNALMDDEVIITAHHAMFDRNVCTHALNINTRRERWRCTMVKAYSHAYPGGLDQLCKILGVPQEQAKLDIGKKLINKFCKPAGKNRKVDRYDRHTDPKDWADFIKYAIGDIHAMRAIDKRLPNWNWREHDIEMYHLDQKINDRGFLVDRELVIAGAKAAGDEKARLAAEFTKLTDGVVDRPTQRAQFAAYLNKTFGRHLDNTRSETFRDILANEKALDTVFARLLELSMLANKTSTAKYASLFPAISPDDRFRGGLQFRGAARTRRWAGRKFQPQNLPSRGLPPQISIDLYIRALKADMHYELFEDLMLYGSAALRGVVIAPKGKTIAVADLSNIEGRVNAFLAGETWKIEAFFDYDAGTGPDLYNVAAGGILGQDPYDVDKKNRNVFGKVPELALGYEGGYGALETFCKSYGVTMTEHEETILANVDPGHMISARTNYTKWGAERNPEADRTEWLLRETIKLSWRNRHPRIRALWKACKNAAQMAIENPGKVFKAGKWLKFKVKRHHGIPYLLVLLPSGKYLCYAEPRISRTDGDTVTYMGLDNTATGGAYGPWRRLYTYGGKIVENACQALAMDIMAHNMPDIDRSGFPIILTVHDEILSETADGTGDELAALMAQCPEWLPGFPLAAAGYTTQRYKKD